MAESIAVSAIIGISPLSGVEPVQSGYGPASNSSESNGAEAIETQGGSGGSGASPVTLPPTGLVWPLGISR